MAGTFAVIVAAGRGHRYGADLPKQYMTLAGRSLLHHSAAAFAGHPAVDEVRVVIHPDDRALYDDAVAGLDLLEPVAGGESRQDSVRLGLISLEEIAPERVLIHDAARPAVDADLIERVLDALDGAPGAIPALAVNDTLKRDGGNRRIAETVERAGLWRAQTPQGFRFGDILDAHRAAEGRALTDDAAVAEAAGLAVSLVEGSEDNLKVTSAGDFLRAERLIGRRDIAIVKTGIGQDSHSFAQGEKAKPFVLGGVEIPCDRSLEGNSDADVVLHALTDAISGVTGSNIIGKVSDRMCLEQGITNSAGYLAEALKTLHGRRIVHVSIAIECLTPKLESHIQTMRERIAELLSTGAENVGITVTSGEGLTAFGRGQGVQAFTIVTIV